MVGWRKGDEPGRGLAFAWGRVVKRDRFRILVFTWGRGEADCGWKEEV